MIKLKIKKNDPVVVTAGKDKGKKSKVTMVDRKKTKVFVENINVVKKHMKPGPQNQEGGIVEKEMPVHISNVMYFCKKCDKGVKLGFKKLESDGKARFCRSCGEVVDKA